MGLCVVILTACACSSVLSLSGLCRMFRLTKMEVPPAAISLFLLMCSYSLCLFIWYEFFNFVSCIVMTRGSRSSIRGLRPEV